MLHVRLHHSSTASSRRHRLSSAQTLRSQSTYTFTGPKKDKDIVRSRDMDDWYEKVAEYSNARDGLGESHPEAHNAQSVKEHMEQRGGGYALAPLSMKYEEQIHWLEHQRASGVLKVGEPLCPTPWRRPGMNMLAFYYRTNSVVVPEQKTFTCYDAAVQAATGMLLEVRGCWSCCPPCMRAYLIRHACAHIPPCVCRSSGCCPSLSRRANRASGSAT